MRRNLLAILVAVATTLGISAPAMAENCATIHEVAITYTFAPGDLYIKVGDCVHFTNTHIIEHSAMGLEREFNTGILMPGGTSILEFDKPIVIPYICSVHPLMSGVLIIE